MIRVLGERRHGIHPQTKFDSGGGGGAVEHRNINKKAPQGYTYNKKHSFENFNYNSFDKRVYLGLASRWLLMIMSFGQRSCGVLRLHPKALSPESGLGGNVGALIIRIGFWGFLIVVVVENTPNSDSNWQGPYIRVERV